jgi:hypothetical protein
VLPINKQKTRSGVLGDTMFRGWPTIDGDTLAFVPIPIATRGAITLIPAAERVDRALARNIEKLGAMGVEWTRADPGDPAANEFRARILEASGDLDGTGNSALENLSTARRAPRQPYESVQDKYVRDIRSGTSNVRLLVKLQRFPQARALADSLLAMSATTSLDEMSQDNVDGMLVGLAALTGHARRIIDAEKKHAADFKVRLASGVSVLPAEVGSDALKIATYGAFGAPRDSITAISTRLSSKLDGLFPASQVPGVRASVLARPLSLAAPSIGPAAAARLGPSRDLFAEALRALASNDRQSARRLADSLIALHSQNSPSEISMDAILQDAWLEAELGEVGAANRILDRAFAGLTKSPSNLLSNAGLPASLIRSMLLRSRLAARLGDTATARHWLDSATSLWSGGDAEVRSILASGR